MWSKRRQEDRKQSIASFRSKITRRKRKLSQSRVATPTQNTDFLVASRLLISNGDLENNDNPNFITISRNNSISRNSSFTSQKNRTTVKTTNTGSSPLVFKNEEFNENGIIINYDASEDVCDNGIKMKSSNGVDSPRDNGRNRTNSFSSRRRQAIKRSSNLFQQQPNSDEIVLDLNNSFHCGADFSVQDHHDITIFSPPARYSDSYVASKFNYMNKNASNKVSPSFLSSNNLKTPSLSVNSMTNTTNHFSDNNKRYDVIGANQPYVPHSATCSERATNLPDSVAVTINDNNMQYGVREKVNNTTSTLDSKRSVKKNKKYGKGKHASNVEIVDNAKKAGGSSKTTESAMEKTTTTNNSNKKPVKESSETNSYLKRVKSKIYKSRSDDSDKVSTDKVNNDQSTNKIKIKKTKEKKSSDKSNKIPKIKENTVEDDFCDVQLRKSDIPLFFRQTSNLEGLRPRTFGLRTSASNIGISDLIDSTSNILKLPIEKPKLIKSKSSSAINLNLLRNRRSKLHEQSKQSSKNADVEFKFVSFNSMHMNETASVSVARKFGPNNPIILDEEVPIQNFERPASWTYDVENTRGDRPPGQPVSRSSSDKRPDAVTEESTRGSADGHHESELDHDITHDNLHNVQRAKSSQPAINRSESYKEQSQKRRQIRERRKISDPNLSKSNDVDSDHQELSYHSGSSSNSSLSSTRSSESPQSTSLDTVPGAHGHHGHGHHHHTHSSASSASAHAAAYDSDMDIEPDPPDWQSSVSEEILARLHPEEKKRQEIINELFHTERSHVRNLKVLDTVFYRPLKHNKCLTPAQVNLLFPNLDKMLEIHGSFNAAMKARRKEEPVIGDIGELLLNMFDGQAGETLKHAAAIFCARQQLALESLKEKRRKDPRLNSFLSECESDKLCKRLQLKDLIPTAMQRLVKYPLLFETLARCTERVLDSTMTDSLPSSSPNTTTTPQMGPTPMELSHIRRALERSKEILNHVNQAVKEAEDKARLEELQKRLDKTNFDKFEHPISTEFRNVDLTKHKLIHEGPLLWRLNKQNKLSVHVVLLEEVILLLQKQDEKYIMKFYSSTSQIHSPIIKVSTVLVRHNATEKESLYLVNTSQNGAQIYDLAAQSTIECKTWFKHISDAAEAYKSREGKSRRSELSTPEPDITSTSSNDLSSTSVTGPNQTNNTTTNGDVDKSSSDGGDAHSTADTDSTSGGGGDSARNSGVLDDETTLGADKEKRLSQTETESSATGAEGGGGSSGGSKREALVRLATDDQPLIQPNEVLINVLPVHTAQPVITTIEQVRRKDEAIRQALAEKEALVAEILHVPPEDYHTIVDMAGDITGADKEPTELVLAAVNQANLLSSLVSESLNISESDPVIAASSQISICASSPVPQRNSTGSGLLPSIPSHRVQTVATALNSQLTTLLKVVKDREDERERMRREIQKLREQLHAMHETQAGQSSVTSTTSLKDVASSSDKDIFHSAGDLANIEEDP